MPTPTNHIVMKEKIFDMGKLQKLLASVEALVYQIPGYLFSFFAPMAAFVASATVLVIIDQFTGIKAAKHRREKITSKGWQRGVSKITMYCLSLIASHVVYLTFLKDSPFDLPLVYGAAVQICCTELVSINENVKQVTGTGISIKFLDPLLNRFRKPKA